MSLLSANEDFQLRTLGAIPGAVEKLAYVAGLRSPEEYEHWGMVRTHGREQAQAAMAANHTQVFAELLCTPLEGLARALDAAPPADATLTPLRQRPQAAIPSDTAGCSARHLSYVLESLSLVERSARASSRPAA